MRTISSDNRYDWVAVEPDCTPPKLLTQLNLDVQWCRCIECGSKRVYSIMYSPKHYGYYCTDCHVSYIARRIV